MKVYKGYKKLMAWQKADELAHQVYKVTKQFPRHETFGIVSQLRRAAVSIPINIAEGSGRQSRGETKHFVNIALGSLAETEYLLDFSKRLDYLSGSNYQEVESLRKQVGALLWKFFKAL